LPQLPLRLAKESLVLRLVEELGERPALHIHRDPLRDRGKALQQVNTNYTVAASGDFRLPDGQEAYPGFDFTPVLGRSDIRFRFLEPSKVIGSSQTRDLDALILSSGAIRPESLATPARLALIVQFGAGVDHIDMDACTRAAVAVVNTADAVRRPVAVAILTLILAIVGRLREKDRLARSGPSGWAQAAALTGVGLRGKTLGSVGLGSIASELVRLVRPLDLNVIAHDPAVTAATAARAGVRWAELDEVFRQSDIVTVNCPLTPATRHLVDAKRLALMKPSAFLINTARGGVVDQRALTVALASGRIAGAGLDVFEQEPADADDPLFTLDNVVVTPHCLCWTDELYRASGEEGVAAVTAVLAGRMPQRMLNPAVATDERWLAKLAALAAKTSRP
jgi:phosphoglycerate dehydrogenase-like enzyme